MVQVVLIDKDDKVVGYEDKETAHKSPLPLHKAISVVIFDEEGKKTLLQKRSSNKPTWPDFWSNTCCTHPLKGESSRQAAKRRLEEEMGFKVPLKEVFTFTYKAKFDDVWGEHELDHVFVGKYSGKIKPNPNEVSEFKWMDIKKLQKEVKNSPDKFTPWFRIIVDKLF